MTLLVESTNIYEKLASYSGILSDINLIDLNTESDRCPGVNCLTFYAELPIVDTALAGLTDFNEQGLSYSVLDISYEAISRDIEEICLRSDVIDDSGITMLTQCDGWLKSIRNLNSVEASYYGSDYLAILDRMLPSSDYVINSDALRFYVPSNIFDTIRESLNIDDTDPVYYRDVLVNYNHFMLDNSETSGNILLLNTNLVALCYKKFEQGKDKTGYSFVMSFAPTLLADDAGVVAYNVAI